MMEDYYKVLNIKKEASIGEIRSAYRQAAKLWHPDRNKSNEAHKRFILINEAYSILIEPNKKSIYDKLYDDYLKDNIRDDAFIFEKKKEYEMYSTWVKESKINTESKITNSINNLLTDSFHFLDKYGCLIFCIIVVLFILIMYLGGLGGK